MPSNKFDSILAKNETFSCPGEEDQFLSLRGAYISNLRFLRSPEHFEKLSVLGDGWVPKAILVNSHKLIKKCMIKKTGTPYSSMGYFIESTLGKSQKN